MAEAVIPPLPADATQEEIDRHWLTHIYRPNDRQLTARALVLGCLLGGVLAVVNLKIGMKIGWSVGMALTSVILAYMAFRTLRSLGIVQGDFTELENNTVASVASAAGYFSSAGMVSAIPALYLTQNITLGWFELVIWISSVCFIGILMAVPMRRQMIDVDRLPFPSGIACAETIRSMHGKAQEALAKARSLVVGGFIGAAFEIPYSVGSIGGWTNPLTWPETRKLPFAIGPWSFADFGLKLNNSVLMYGLGAILGIRVGVSLGIGAILAYGVFGPWLARHGVVIPGETTIYRSMTAWSIWPGMIMVVVASFLSFGLRWRTIVRALGSLRRVVGGGAEGGMAAVEVPGSWLGWGLLTSTAAVVICARTFFGIPIWMAVLAVLLAFLLAMVACRATGETDVPPVGPLGKIAQLVYAGIAPGQYVTNLMTANITAGAASHSADLLTDLKTSYLLGGSPRRQFLAQLLGIFAGAAFCVPAYLILVQPEKIGEGDLAAPAAQQWAAVADLLAHGVSYETRGSGAAVPTTVEAVGLSKRLPGMRVGDTLRIAEGPNRGDYRIAMLERSTLVLDRPLVQPGSAEAQAELLASTGASRGTTRIARVTSRPGLRFTTLPLGVQPGDYVQAWIAGEAMYYKLAGLDGTVGMLDHAFIDAAQPVPVIVEKLGLPPYALGVTLGTVLFGVIVTLLEIYGPRRWRPYLPSVTGLGIAWVVGCWDSLALAIGAIVAWLLAKAAPRLAERYTISASSGIVAGASLLGLAITLLRDILGWIGGVE